MQRLTTISVLALSTFACMTQPGVLEGGNDDVGEGDTNDTNDTNDTIDPTGDPTTGDSEGVQLAECLQGTNPMGGADPGDFPIADCEMTCDEGWGHGAPTIPIEWTLDLSTFEAEPHEFAHAVVPLASGEGVVVVVTRSGGGENAIELLRVSAQGEVLGTSSMPTSLPFVGVAGSDGVIYVGSKDPQTSQFELVALSEMGEVLWSYTNPEVADPMIAAPEGGVILAFDNANTLVRLDAEGSTLWTIPTLDLVLGLALTPSGRILVGGQDDASVASMRLYSPSGESFGEWVVPATPNELAGLTFLDETRLVATGNLTSDSKAIATATLFDLDAPALLDWSHRYSRGLTSCASEDPSTFDFFSKSIVLADGTLLINGALQGPTILESSAFQPAVFHIDPQGEVLGSDIGLWFGWTVAITTDAENAAYAVMSQDPSECATCPNNGFYLRKYQP